MARDWIVMAGYDMTKGKQEKSVFDKNATDLTEAQANTEAKRRNKAEKAACNKTITWFACQNPIALARAAGMDISFLEGSK